MNAFRKWMKIRIIKYLRLLLHFLIQSEEFIIKDNFYITIPRQLKVANNTVILLSILCFLIYYFFSLSTQAITICILET